MRLYIDRIPFWAVAVIQVLSFVFILLTAASSLLPIFVILFFALEVIIFTSIIYKKKKKYFYLGWELEFFLLILFLILFNFDRTFQVSNPSPITITVFAISIIAVETIILIYFIFRERAIKGILLALASSTTIIVFLIVIFVMKEGLPAFQENGPVQFIMGTEWQPFYSEGSSESAIVKTTIKPYDFTISTDDNSIYILPYSSQNISIKVTNTGGKIDTILLLATTTLTYEMEKDIVTLAPYESQSINLSINTGQEGKYTVEVRGVSNATSQGETVEIECISSPCGIDLYPDRQTVLGVEAQAGLLQAPLEIINTGNSNDTFTLSIDAPGIFRPSIEGIAWDYSTSSGSIELMSGESRNLTIRPRIVTCIEGTYDINITAVSWNYPDVIDSSKLIFQYKREHHLLIEETSQPISKNGTANYTLILSGGTNEILGIQIDNPDNRWKYRLQNRETVILDGEGTTNVTLGRNGSITLNLMVTPLDGENGDTLDIKITAIQWGTKPTFGILPFIIGTVLTTLIAVLIAAPLGLGCAIFLAEFCPSKIRKILRPLYELLAGIPSVIYGLWGFLTFGPFIGEHVYPFISNTIGRHIGFFSAESTTGRGVLTASIVLSIMILPIIITLSEDAIRTVRRELKEASLALGATRWQTMKKVIIPKASSGIISSIILGTGRAIGETMAVLMIMGATSQIPTSIFEPVGTMTSVIASAFGWSFTSDLTRHALFGIGTILFFMIFTLNVIIFMIQKRTTNGKQKKTGWHSPIQKIKKLCAKKKFIIANKEENNESRIIEKKFTIVDDAKYSKFTIIENIDDKAEENLTNIKDKHNKQAYTRYRRTSSKKATRNELLVKIALVIGAIIATSFLFLILGDVVVKGGLLIKPEFLFVREIMGGLEGGFANAIAGSLFLVALALGVATPLALGTAIYVQEYAKASNPLTRIIMFASDTLASTPSIIFGAFGFMFFVLFLEFKFSLIAGGLTLAIMVIPLMLRSSIEAIKSIPNEYREASYAVGATRWQTIQHVVLPPAMPGITSGMIISIGRAIGETAAVMFTAGYASTIATSIMHPAASMPNLIYNYYELSTKWPVVGAKIYSAALVLIIIVLILNFLAKMMKYRSEKMMKGN